MVKCKYIYCDDEKNVSVNLKEETMKSHPFRSRKTLFFLGPIAVLLLVLTGFIAVKGPFGAHAAGPLTLYVGHGTPGINSDCSSPGYNSVQTAVDVANPGNVVYLCGTTPFYEQVVIEKAITLTGDPGATIAAPAPFPTTSPLRLPSQFTTDNLFVPQAIVFVWGASANPIIKGLTIAGPLPGNGSCADQEFGVLVIDNAKATLTGDQVQDIRDSNASLYGCQFGVGIQVGREYWPKADFSSFVKEDFVGHATIKGTTVSGYQKNGVTVDDTGSTANLSSNTVNGDGRVNSIGLSAIIAQNGIQFSRGAKGQAIGNTVTGNSYTGNGGASSGGILVYGGSCGDPNVSLTTGIQIKNNNLQDNDVGAFVSNLIADANNNCALPITATNITVYGNHITDSAVSNTSGTNLFNFPGGYQAGISDEGNADHLTTNKICGVGYTPVAPPPYLSHIDVAATDPVISGNTTCTSSTAVNASAQPQRHYGLRSIVHPYK